MNTSLRLIAYVMTVAIGAATLLIAAPVQAADDVAVQRVEIVGKRLGSRASAELPMQRVVVIGQRLPPAAADAPIQRVEIVGVRERKTAAMAVQAARLN